ncbi:uncharacterized protein LOC125374833 [Haliotis rufescens]|uniref:uncharacterized protein LOC125374833 n=1 Tax=Haliotis rufescens TaxID=6454 RepID=UPI00201F1868|nr:uncharacterized protein LOC125374833 [Haliotis rufescens]
MRIYYFFHSALVTYLTCLEGSGKGDDGCPLPPANATATETDFTSANCSTEADFTNTCICQKDFWKTNQNTNATKCSATTAYIACLKWKTKKACDGSTTVTALATGVETRIKDLGSTACPVTPTCQCEINATKADIASDAKMCTVLTTLRTCLSAINTTDELGCATDTQATLLNDTNTKIATCAADHVTFAMTSLFVSVLVNMFL